MAKAKNATKKTVTSSKAAAKGKSIADEAKAKAAKEKAATKAAEKAKQTPAAAPEMVRAYATRGGKSQRYAELQHNRRAFSAYTIASAIVSGLVKLSAKGLITKGDRPQVALFGALVGTTARNHWRKAKRLDDGGFTVAGLNEVNARLQGATRGYNTDMDTVKALMAAIEKGATIEISGAKYAIDSPVAVKKA